MVTPGRNALVKRAAPAEALASDGQMRPVPARRNLLDSLLGFTGQHFLSIIGTAQDWNAVNDYDSAVFDNVIKRCGRTQTPATEETLWKITGLSHPLVPSPTG